MNKIYGLSLFILLVFLSSSCNSQQKAFHASAANRFEEISHKDQSSSQDKQVRQMLIYNASMGIVVTEPDSLMDKWIAISQQYEGYVLNQSSHHVTLRVKSDHLKAGMQSIAHLGKVKYKHISTEDVSVYYSDLSTRLDNAYKARERYLALLNKAEDVQSAVSVEKELERLTNEIESIKGQMNRYEHLEAYSTIRVDVERKVKLGVLGYVGKGLYATVKWLFVRN